LPKLSQFSIPCTKQLKDSGSKIKQLSVFGIGQFTPETAIESWHVLHTDALVYSLQ